MKEEKMIEMVHVVLQLYEGYTLEFSKLMVLLYLSDRDALLQTGVTISGNHFYARQQGPLLKEIYDLFSGASQDVLMQIAWNSRFVKKSGTITALSTSPVPLYELNTIEDRIIRHVDTLYHALSTDELIAVFRDPVFCPEWPEAAQSGAPLSWENILRGHGVPEEQVTAIIEERDIFDKEVLWFYERGSR